MLAGTFAGMWGNAEFDAPSLDGGRFARGVALHDWHYGPLDNLPIGGLDPTGWLETVRKGVVLTLPDATEDIVAKLHIRRLLSYDASPERAALIGRIDAHVAERLPATGHALAEFRWADRITNLCDRLAFDFAFEQPVKNTCNVYARLGRSDETTLTYEVQAGGEMLVHPWPFSSDRLSGFVLGYAADGYPDTLTAHLVPYHIRPAG